MFSLCWPVVTECNKGSNKQGQIAVLIKFLNGERCVWGGWRGRMIWQQKPVCFAGGDWSSCVCMFPEQGWTQSSVSLFPLINLPLQFHSLILYFPLFHCSFHSSYLSLSLSWNFPPSCLLAKLLLLNTYTHTHALPHHSHVFHSLSSGTIQQLCPDFSEGLASKKLYLPGQTQNQYPSNANTAHREFSRSANDAGDNAEFSDYRAEMAGEKKKRKWIGFTFGTVLPPITIP